jgi:sugar transferase EpsL
MEPGSLVVKRAFDVVLTVLTAPIWLAVLLILGIAVRVAIGRPIFFTQLRAGHHGRAFLVVKLRTMTNARAPDGTLLADVDRLGRFGRLLRATSLDELPELWNVLRGEMSLVGPRPLLLEYVPLYTSEQARRHDVRPGLTGWAQINGRNAIGWADRFALDVWYVDNRSLALDVRILALTLLRVFQRRGISAQDDATMPRFLGTAGDGADADAARSTFPVTKSS